MSPVEDARASLKLAQQKVVRCRDAIAHGETAEALGELRLAELSVEDAESLLVEEETRHE